MAATTRVALITGAAGAIGSATARRLAQDGFVLALADLWPAGAEPQLPEGLRLQLDVRSADQVRAAVDRTLAAHGRIDVLVNVAGITSFGSAQQLAEDEWQRVLDINLGGTFRCCQAVMPAMKARGMAGSSTSGRCSARTAATPGHGSIRRSSRPRVTWPMASPRPASTP